MAQTSILFVDDEEVIRTSFTRELQAEHFAVTAAAASCMERAGVPDCGSDITV